MFDDQFAAADVLKTGFVGSSQCSFCDFFGLTHIAQKIIISFFQVAFGDVSGVKCHHS